MEKKLTSGEKNILTQICTTWVHNNNFLIEVIIQAWYMLEHNKKISSDDNKKEDKIFDDIIF